MLLILGVAAMAYFSPPSDPDKDDGFINQLRALSKAAGIMSPATPATLDSFSSEKAYPEATPEFNTRGAGKSINDLIDTAFIQSPDESVFFIYDDDDDENIKSNARKQQQHQHQQEGSYQGRTAIAAAATRTSITHRNRSRTDNDSLNSFQEPTAAFRNFRDDPFPTNLSVLVEQFANVIEAEERFVRLYKQNFQLNANSTRRVLAEQGFQFQKAKMVSMLSSKALRAAVSEKDKDKSRGYYDNNNNDDDDDDACSRLCFNAASPQQDDLSVVMSICTAGTGRTGGSDATSITAARLMQRLMDPSDHDSVISKEIRKLSPSELAARFVDMQEKLKRKQQKKEKRKKKSKKKKKKKEKQAELEAEEYAYPTVEQGLGQQPKSILKKSTGRDWSVPDLDATRCTAPVLPRSRTPGRKGDVGSETYGKDSFSGHDGRVGGGAGVAPLKENFESMPPPPQHRRSSRGTAGRSPTPRKSETPPPRQNRRHVFSLPPRVRSGRGLATGEATGSGLEPRPVAKKPFWKKLFNQGY